MPPILAARLLNTIQEPKRREKKREDVGSIRFGFYFREKGRKRGWGEGGVFFLEGRGGGL